VTWQSAASRRRGLLRSNSPRLKRFIIAYEVNDAAELVRRVSHATRLDSEGIDWNTATAENKLEFFYGWFSNLENRINATTAEIDSLRRRRLDEIERKS
jgi:hypothetical protein